MSQSQQKTDDGRQEQDTGGADVTSDPARDDATGSDWSDEGGATEHGPATDVDATSPSDDEDGD